MKVSGWEVDVSTLWSKSNSMPVGFSFSAGGETEAEMFCSEFPAKLKKGEASISSDPESGKLTLACQGRGSIVIETDREEADAIYRSWNEATLKIDRPAQCFQAEFRIYALNICAEDLHKVS